MKIIQIIQRPQLRGAEIFACQLSNHLLDMGHHVVVVSIFNGDAELPFKGKIIRLNRADSKRFIDFRGWKHFNDLVRKIKPDLVQANAADTLKFAASSKKLYSWKQPLIFRNANKIGDFINSKIKLRVNKFYLSEVTQVISVSRECEKDFISTFNYPQRKISTVEIGVEEKEPGNIPEDLQVIYNKGPVIVHIGGFVPEKNHTGLLNIFGKLLKSKPHAQLILIGKGPLKNSIVQKTKEMNIKNQVHFLGYRTDVLDILQNSKAFVLPSLIEGLPAVILEAMFCETPVVAYNVGGVGEVVDSTATGWLVNKGDENNFENSLYEILHNEEEVIKKTTKAKKMISENFLNKIIAERFLKVYNSVAE